MKILLYIIFVILIIRFIRSLINTRIIIQKFDSRHQRDDFERNRKKEGEITIIEPGKNVRTGESGEYAEYEEIK